MLIDSRGLRYTKIMKLLHFFCHTYLAHYYGKKKSKRIGRPPGGHSNLACALKKASKRRKRCRNWLKVGKKELKKDRSILYLIGMHTDCMHS